MHIMTIWLLGALVALVASIVFFVLYFRWTKPLTVGLKVAAWGSIAFSVFLIVGVGWQAIGVAAPPPAPSPLLAVDYESAEPEPAEPGIPEYITIRGEQFSTALTELELFAMGLTNEDIEPLRYMVNLELLALGGNQISDLTPLADLTNLENLQLQNNQVSDLTPLTDLTNLESLFLGRNQISDISSLAGLTNLQYLYLSSNIISDLMPLSNLINLENLLIQESQISDITPLAGLTNLQDLFLTQSQISDLAPLANLTNLRQLQLFNNQISDLAPLSNLTNLEILSLNNNPITDWSPVEHVPNVNGKPYDWASASLPDEPAPEQPSAQAAQPQAAPTQPPAQGPPAHSIIEFGGYTWLVLEVRDDRVLVVKELLIRTNQRFDNRGAFTWATSDIRRYLNNDFYNSFSPQNRSRILETTVVTNNNPWFGTPGGGNTTDRIFLLSIEEVVRYFGDSGQLANRNHSECYLSDQYNNNRIAAIHQRYRPYFIGQSWSTRSPSACESVMPYSGQHIEGTPTHYITPANVNHFGQIHMRAHPIYRSLPLRPAMWIQL